MPDMKELPKLYIDLGKPNGDETAISIFDEDGTAHTESGIIARYIVEQAKQLTQTQQALDSSLQTNKALVDRLVIAKEALENIERITPIKTSEKLGFPLVKICQITLEALNAIKAIEG